MDMGPLSAVSTAVAAFGTIWSLFSNYRVTRSRGKRISYSFYISLSGKSFLERLLLAIPGTRKHAGRKGSGSSQRRKARIFIWNSGTESISSEDLFLNKPLLVVFESGVVKSVETFFESSGAVQFKCVVEPVTKLIGISKEGFNLGRSARLEFEYLPPGHGAIFDFMLEGVDRIVPGVEIEGPVRNLKAIYFAGGLYSLRSKKQWEIRKRAILVKWLAPISLACWGGSYIYTAVESGLSFHSRYYWIGLGLASFFQVTYMLLSDYRSQVEKRVPRSLAYWCTKNRRSNE